MLQNFVSVFSKIKIHFTYILFYLLGIGILYFNFWLFFQLVERQIDFTLMSSVFLHLSTCLALSLPYFWVKKRKEILLWILLFINIYLSCNLLYYRTYITILSFDSYTMIGNLWSLSDSIISAFHRSDILFFLPTAVLWLLHSFTLRKRIVVETLKTRLVSSGLILVFVLSTIGINLFIERNQVSNMLSDENEFKYDIVDGASTYGFLHCWIWQFRSDLDSKKELTAVEKAKIEKWFSQHKQFENVENSFNVKGKNVILIIVESLESFPIGKKLAGQEITPYLNRFINDKNSFYASKVVPQVNIGHSSDTQLIFNTGLLPPHAGAACFLHQHNTYFTLAKALRSEGYNSHTLLGGNGSFWNQGVMNKTLGYDELISIEQYRDDESYDFGLTDSTFLSQSVEKLIGFKSPFLAQLITLSSHDPYILLNNRIYLKTPKDCPSELGRYLNAIHYVDKCLGIFVDSLRKNGLMDKSIVLIAGDHDATKQQPEQWKNYVKKHWDTEIGFTPVLILNSPVRKIVSQITGQIDVYPTLMDMLGLKTYKWHGLGQSMLDKNKNPFAVNARFDEFGVIQKVSSQAISQSRSAWEISDLIITKDYFKNE